MNMNNKRAAMKTQQCRNVCINSIFKLKYGKRIVICTLKFFEETESEKCLTQCKNSNHKATMAQNRASTAAITGGDDGYGCRSWSGGGNSKVECIYCWHDGYSFFFCVFFAQRFGYMMQRIEWRAYPLTRQSRWW